MTNCTLLKPNLCIFQVRTMPSVLGAALSGKASKWWKRIVTRGTRKHKSRRCPEMSEADFKVQKKVQQYFYVPVKSCNCKHVVASGSVDKGFERETDDGNGMLMVIGSANQYDPAGKSHTESRHGPKHHQENTPVLDPLLPDPVLPDAGLTDTVLPDAGLPDTVLPDHVLPDPVAPDPVLLDPVLPDPGLPDTVLTNPMLPDSVLPDLVAPDPVLPVSMLPDSVLPDPLAPDPVLLDHVLPVSMLPDSVLTDPGLPDSVLFDPVPPDDVPPDDVMYDPVLLDPVPPDSVLPGPAAYDPVLSDPVLPNTVLIQHVLPDPGCTNTYSLQDIHVNCLTKEVAQGSHHLYLKAPPDVKKLVRPGAAHWRNRATHMRADQVCEPISTDQPEATFTTHNGTFVKKVDSLQDIRFTDLTENVAHFSKHLSEKAPDVKKLARPGAAHWRNRAARMMADKGCASVSAHHPHTRYNGTSVRRNLSPSFTMIKSSEAAHPTTPNPKFTLLNNRKCGRDLINQIVEKTDHLISWLPKRTIPPVMSGQS